MKTIAYLLILLLSSIITKAQAFHPQAIGHVAITDYRENHDFPNTAQIQKNLCHKIEILGIDKHTANIKILAALHNFYDNRHWAEINSPRKTIHVLWNQKK